MSLSAEQRGVPAKDAHRVGPPVGASPGYPGWVCKNNCGKKFEESFSKSRCPRCGTPLVRWIRYEIKD